MDENYQVPIRDLRRQGEVTLEMPNLDPTSFRHAKDVLTLLDVAEAAQQLLDARWRWNKVKAQRKLAVALGRCDFSDDIEEALRGPDNK